jgi:uncharacterized protein YeaO (DUF488 family)
MYDIRVKRIYDEPESGDGLRVLVDRLWARGITKEKAMLGIWAKEIAPSNELRKEYHNSGDASSFRDKYLEELRINPSAEEIKETIKGKLKSSNVTLLTSAKNMDYNHCHVIKEWLK